LYTENIPVQRDEIWTNVQKVAEGWKEMHMGKLYDSQFSKSKTIGVQDVAYI